MEDHKIISVKIVSGSNLNSRWRSPMQKITTDRGEFIDNMPGKQFGYFKDANPGFDWQSKIDQIVHNIRVIDHAGFRWLNK
ncbi:MAG TPA: hypothetical protein DCW42_04535 [Bacteroidetes bacterium]|nr:hypothetical protein [Bacteroidota bacterium]